MRHRLIIIVVFLTSLFSCEVVENKSVAITIMADRTGKHISKPVPDQISRLIGIDSNTDVGVSITYLNIGHVDFNPEVNLNLQQGSVFDNDIQRKGDVRQFKREFDSLIAFQNQKEYSYSNSSILVPLINQLTELKNKKATKKVVFLYSDLQEFSDVYDVYHPKNLNLLLNDPKLVASDIKNKLNLSEDYSNITLLIEFYPKTVHQNRTFTAMLEVYRSVFEDTGLKIQVGISNHS